tara:strand:+ start:267 stop:737 length:471 start_codon:yes stop_codon:yes gene_type:complete
MKRVRHRTEPELYGGGVELARGRGSDRRVLVKWDDGTQQFHDRGEIMPEGKTMKITKRQLRRIIREQMASTSYQGNLDPEIALVNTVRDLVGNHVMFFDFKHELLAAGFDGTEVTTEPISMVTVPDINGKMFVITSKRNVEDPDHVVGSYAIGPLE